jgi:hypothetical protein
MPKTGAGKRSYAAAILYGQAIPGGRYRGAMQWQSIRGQYAAMEAGAGNPGDPGRVFSPGRDPGRQAETGFPKSLPSRKALNRPKKVFCKGGFYES